MKTIETAIDTVNKFGDTSTIFKLDLKDDNEYVPLDDKKVVLNVANDTGLVLTTPMTTFSGHTVMVDFSSHGLAELTPDSYNLEIEVTYSDGDVSKFPTKGGLKFNITNNLKETTGALVPTVTFDNVLEAVDEKIAVYMDTVKVGPQGPKGDMDLSQITVGGRNYFLNSSGTSMDKWSQDGGWTNIDSATRGGVFTISTKTTWSGGITNSLYQSMMKIDPGTMVTVSFWAKASVDNANFHLEQTGGTATFDTKLTTAFKKYSYTFVLTSKTVYFTGVDAGTTYYLDGIKIEIGNIATDWTPAPEDVPSNDTQLVHNTGNETVAGNKTFIGNNNFSGTTTLQTGNYGLRVTTAGVQKTSDNGVTWTNI